MHKGIDVKVYIGDTIRAAFSGKVRIVRYEANGYGTMWLYATITDLRLYTDTCLSTWLKKIRL